MNILNVYDIMDGSTVTQHWAIFLLLSLHEAGESEFSSLGTFRNIGLSRAGGNQCLWRKHVLHAQKLTSYVH